MLRTSRYKDTIGAIAIFIAMALSWLTASAEGREGTAGGDTSPQPPTEARGSAPDASSSPLTVSLITCYPGPEIYELCGHEAIRVRGAGIDSVWNFGMFNFHEPNFVYRFVKGETDYMCIGYPFGWFLPEYVKRGSKVVEQDLNLTYEESRQLLELLREHALPDNRTYRYNYVKDNCATRILDQIEKASGSKVIWSDSVRYGTFRKEMRSYHRNYPWYQFGIDLVLGSGLDCRLEGKEEMFVPVEMMKGVASSRFSDGRNLITRERVLNEGTEEAVLPATPWWATPMTVGIVLVAAAIAFCVWSFRKMRLISWVYAVWFFICGLAGTLVAFLVFISSHEATSPNIILIWLNPLQLLTAVCMFLRPLRPGALALAGFNVVALLCLLIVWPFQPQSGNPAMFPFMATTLLLASAYAIIGYKDSYNNNGVSAKKPGGIRGKHRAASESNKRTRKK